MPSRIFISIGDLSAANYIYEIFRDITGNLEIHGITDHRLESIGFKSAGKIEDISVTGFIEVFPRLIRIKRTFDTSVETLKNCDVLVACDAPGFNIPLIKKARKLGVRKVIYFISPQVWAWKKGRAKTIASYCDHIIVILPFEVEIYRSLGANSVHYEGHPLIDLARATTRPEEFREKLSGGKELIALLPGSRWSELKKHLPYVREVLNNLGREDLTAVVPTFGRFRKTVEKHLRGLNVKIVTEDEIEKPAYEVMNSALCGLIASGTASLEAALFRLPHLIFYRVNPITYWSARMVLSIDSINLPNILLGQMVVGELINESPQKTASLLLNLIQDENLREFQREKFETLREMLGGEGVIKRLRALFLELLS